MQVASTLSRNRSADSGTTISIWNPFTYNPKEKATVKFAMDYRRENQQLVRNTYSFPRIDETIHKLGGFQYATALYINMWHYTIRISTASQDMKNIVNEFFIFRYNRLMIGMCSSIDIFQTKVYDLLGDNKCIKSYINVKLV